MIGNCRNCQAELFGKFCAVCGQKTIVPEERKLSHIAEEFFHYFTHLDGKFFKTVKNILLKPGLVTNDIINGITARHYKPSSLFLLVTLIYFLIPNKYIISNNMVTPYQVEVEGQGIGAWKRTLALNKSSRTGLSEKQLAENFNEKKHAYSKLLTFLLIPLVIVVLAGVQVICRVFRKYPGLKAYDLGIASLELNSMILLVFYVFSGLLFFIISLIGSEWLLKIVAIVSAIATMLLIRGFLVRVFKLNIWQSILMLAFCVAGYLAALFVYGLITFVLFI